MGIVIGKIPVAVVHTISKFTLPSYKGELSLSKEKYNQITSGDVRILRDKFGCAHIYGKNYFDVFFGQGFVTAQERLFSLEITRRVAKGLLAEIKPEAVVVDRLTRTMGFYRIAQQDAKELCKDDIKKILSFAGGINAFLEKKTYSAPIEIRLGKLPKPKLFTLEDILAIFRLICWQMNRGFFGKIVNIAIKQVLGEKDESLDYNNFMDQNWDQLCELILNAPPEQGGTNSFMVNGKHTKSGYPLFENDPHLGVKSPSIWLNFHLSCPEFDAVGYTICGAYGLQLGHNQFCAFGVTVSYCDSFEIYMEEINPENEDEYKYNGKWEKCKIVNDVITIKGSDKTENHKTRYTKHGPLLTGNLDFQVQDKKRYEFSIKGICFERFKPNSITKVMDLCMAKDWIDFRMILSACKELSILFTYADVTDTIGCFNTGAIPIRTEKAIKMGGQPVPGWTDEYEWQGYQERQPQDSNPECGYMACCNQNYFKDIYPHYLGKFFKPPWRSNRIKNILSGIIKTRKVSIEDAKKIIYDTKYEGFERITKLMDYILFDPKEDDDIMVVEAAKLLKSFKGDFKVGSVGASLYVVFEFEMIVALLKQKKDLDEKLLPRVMGFGLSKKFLPLNEYFVIKDVVLHKLFNKIPEKEKRSFIHERILDVIVRLEKLVPEKKSKSLKRSISKKLTFSEKKRRKVMKESFRRFKYGKIHNLTFNHALGEKIKQMNKGPYPVGGTWDTVFATGYDFDGINFKCYHYPSAIFLADLQDLDNAQGIMTPGTSAHIASPFFADSIDEFLSGKLRKMHFNEKDVEKNKHSQMTIKFVKDSEMFSSPSSHMSKDISASKFLGVETPVQSRAPNDEIEKLKRLGSEENLSLDEKKKRGFGLTTGEEIDDMVNQAKNLKLEMKKKREEQEEEVEIVEE